MLIATRFFWFIRLFIRCGGWIALFPLIIGVLVTVQAITLEQNATQLTANGINTTAIVLAKRYEQGNQTASERQRPSTSYYVSFHFKPDHGKIDITNEHRVKLSYYNSVKTGQTIAVRYLPDNPMVQELYENELANQTTSSQVVGMAFALLGFATGIWFAKTAIRALRARENVGMIIEAYVTHRSYWPPVFNRMQYQVGTGNTAKLHKTFIRPIWAYGGLKRGEKARVAITSKGPYWAKDLFL